MARGVTGYTRSQRQLVRIPAKVIPRLSTQVNTENEGRKGVDDERNMEEGRELWGRYRTKARELHIRGSSGNEVQNWSRKKHKNWDHRFWIGVGHYFFSPESKVKLSL